MIPGPDRVLARRHLVVTVLRLLALLLVLAASACLIHGVIAMLGSWSGPGRGLRPGLLGRSSFRQLALVGSLLLPGLLLILLDRRLARWAVPLPRPECPRCLYRLHDRPARCPECGLTLGAGPANGA